MSTVKVHPLYPFVRIGLAYDLYPGLAANPGDHVVHPDEWTIDLENRGLDGASYWSEAAAYDAVEAVLFDEWHIDMIERQILLAREQADWDLVLRLVEGRAHAQGYRVAQKNFAAMLRQYEKPLKELLRLTGA